MIYAAVGASFQQNQFLPLQPRLCTPVAAAPSALLPSSSTRRMLIRMVSRWYVYRCTPRHLPICCHSSVLIPAAKPISYQFSVAGCYFISRTASQLSTGRFQWSDDSVLIVNPRGFGVGVLSIGTLRNTTLVREALIRVPTSPNLLTRYILHPVTRILWYFHYSYP